MPRVPLPGALWKGVFSYDTDHAEDRRHDVRHVRSPPVRCRPQHFSVNKVTASHTKGEMVILSPEPLGRAALEKTIADTGYTLVSVTEGAAAEKKGGFLGLFKK